MNRYHYALQGTHCISCLMNIEKILKAIPGVTEVVMDVTRHAATVTGSNALTSHTLVQAIEAAGYGASLLDEQGQTTPQSEQAEHQAASHLKIKTVIALLVAVPLFVISLFMDMPDLHSPIGYSLNLSLGLLSLAVMGFAGGPIFASAGKALIRGRANMNTLIALGTGIAWLYSMMVLLFTDFFHRWRNMCILKRVW